MKQWRVTFVYLLFLLFALGIVFRLVFLQIVKYGFYKSLSQGQQDSTLFQKGQRGSIFAYDKKGNMTTLAANQKIPFVFVSPSEVQDQEIVASRLSSILKLDKNILLSKVGQSASLYEVIKKRITKQEEEAIKKENFKGVHVQDENVRFYPQGELASHIIGFTNQDLEGQYGVEEQYNDLLKGREGALQNMKNPAAYFLSALSDTVQNGSDVTLTIDPNIQLEAESLLKEAKQTINAKEGTIIVIDPRDGKILALADAPNFNANEYAKVKDFAVFQNAAVEKIFEPGSVFKAITMALAIDSASVTPETTYTDKGILRIGGYKILNYDSRTWGERTMKDVLDFSINTGAVFAEQQAGNITFLEYVKKFGIFEPTNIDLPGEIYSQNKELLNGREINYATASFGQGIEITPMQLVRAYAAIANGGRLVTPFITLKAKPKISDPIISKQSASTITSMLVDVLENGYGKAAKIPGYYIAGKTGTAQISFSALGIQKSGYSDKTVQSFIGYAPAYNPQFLILVKLNDPKAKTAEYSAEPIFKKLAKYVIDYLEIPPDYEP